LGDLSEFPLKYKLFLKAYPWRRIDPVPWAPLKKPLKDSQAAVISSAGLVRPNQEPFDDSIRGGDYSFREIPADTDVSTLKDTHRSDLTIIPRCGRIPIWHFPWIVCGKWLKTVVSVR